MFEDICDSKKDGRKKEAISFSVDIKDDYWEHVKEHPEKLEALIRNVMNAVITTKFLPSNVAAQTGTYKFINGTHVFDFKIE